MISKHAHILRCFNKLICLTNRKLPVEKQGTKRRKKLTKTASRYNKMLCLFRALNRRLSSRKKRILKSMRLLIPDFKGVCERKLRYLA